jgi:hypothetical protein
VELALETAARNLVGDAKDGLLVLLERRVVPEFLLHPLLHALDDVVSAFGILISALIH